MKRLLACLALFASPAAAGDWPQILGPNRDGVAVGERLADVLPAAPRPTWTLPVGDGFAGPAVVDGVVYLHHRVGESERAAAVDAAAGRTLWTADAPTLYTGAIVSDAGPRCVPVVAGDRVILYGAEGRLRCLDRGTGAELWSDATHETFGVPQSYFGAGSTPLVEGGLVIVNVGGARREAGVVAFDLATGAVKWTATADQASYSSPIAATIGGERRVVVVARRRCVGLDPATGKVLWSVPFGARGPTVTAANPVLLGETLFLTASYNVGAAAFKLSADDATELWRDDLLSSQYTTPIALDGLLYGVDGRQDGGPASLVCVDPAARQVLWTQKDFGYATLVLADGKLLAQKTDGELVLVRPDKAAYAELGRASLTKGTARALPALSDGRWFLRDETTLSAYDLAPERAAPERAAPEPAAPE